MFDHLELAIAVVLRPTFYVANLTDEERAALAAARPFGGSSSSATSPVAWNRAYASQLSEGLPK
jgi:hypothetical protein